MTNVPVDADALPDRAGLDSDVSDDETQTPVNPSQVIVYNLPRKVTVDFLREPFEGRFSRAAFCRRRSSRKSG
jgi:hypothetical protein